MNTTEKEIKGIELEVNVGNAVMEAARRYPTVHKSVIESVQNSVDKKASIIWIDIDYTRNGNRIILIQDNGEGADQGEVNKAFKSLYQSIKRKGKYGKFGMGMVSPVDKCRTSTFTSFDRNLNEYTSYVFQQHLIEGVKNPVIPQRREIELTNRRDSKTNAIFWNTQVKMEKVTTDPRMSIIDPQKLKEEILNSFREGMIANEMTVNLKFRAKGTTFNETFGASQYNGKPLEKVASECESVKATFEMYVAAYSHGGRKGEVSVGCSDDPFRFYLKDLLKNVPSETLEKEVAKALTSGIFEGDIVIKGVKLDPRRDRFVEGVEIDYLFSCLETWFENVGKKIYDDIAAQKEMQRYQENGIKALESLRKILSDPSNKSLWEFAKGFKKEEVDEDGEEDGEVPPPPEKDPKKKKPKKKEVKKKKPKRDKDIKVKVIDPDTEQRRTRISDKNTGITLELVEMFLSDKIWEMNSVTGVLSVNCRHWIFAKVAANDKLQVKYLRLLMMEALSIEIETEEAHESLIENATRVLGCYVTQLLVE